MRIILILLLLAIVANGNFTVHYEDISKDLKEKFEESCKDIGGAIDEAGYCDLSDVPDTQDLKEFNEDADEYRGWKA